MDGVADWRQQQKERKSDLDLVQDVLQKWKLRGRIPMNLQKFILDEESLPLDVPKGTQGTKYISRSVKC